MNREDPHVESAELSLRARQIVERVVLADRGVEKLTLDWLIVEHPHLECELRAQWRILERIHGVLHGDVTCQLDRCCSDGVTTQPRLVIPGYEVQGRIGNGGQASVFKALQLSTGQTVAIKALYGSGLSSESSRRRFDREIRVLVELNHPNVVSVIDRGATAEGTPYVVMRYVDGFNLDEWWKLPDRKVGKYDPASMLALFIDISHAVNAAHRKGIVHRDLKPSNIRIDSHGTPHVLDFGLARVLMPQLMAASSQPASTQTGHFVGTLPWASPEQIGAIKAPIEPYSDVFALGIVFYEMIANRIPFDAGESLGDLMNSMRNSIPLTPSLVGRRGADREMLGPRVGPALDAVILKAIQISPLQRYQNAGELACDLERVAEGRCPTALTHRPRSQRIRWVVAGLVMVGFIASMVGYRAAIGDPMVKIVGRVWDDADSNGLMDGQESGLPGIIVYEDCNHNGMLDPVATADADAEVTAVTNRLGKYQFKVSSPPTIIRCEVPVSARATFPCPHNGGRATAYAFIDANTVRRLSWPPSGLPVIDAGDDFDLNLTQQSQAELRFLATLHDAPRELFQLRDDELLVSVFHEKDRQFLLRIWFEQRSARVRYLGSLPLERKLAQVIDVNGDRIDDLVLRAGIGVPNRENTWYLQIALGKIDGTFDLDTPPWEFARQQRNANVAIADVDQDGIQDLLFSLIPSGGFFTFELRFARGKGDGTFACEGAPIILRGPDAHGLTLHLPIDLDRDGDFDLFLTADDDTQNEGLSYVAIQQQPGHFELKRFIDFQPDRNDAGQDLSTVGPTFFLDVDRDGGLDLLVSIASHGNDPLRLFRDVDRALTEAIANEWPFESVASYASTIGWPREHAARLATSGTHRISAATEGSVPPLYFGISQPPAPSKVAADSKR